jgi:uncharacterized membrane protein
MRFGRFLRHVVAPRWWAARAFDRAAREAIRDAIVACERRHSGELRFVVEASLPVEHLFKGTSARQRAAELFSQLRIWDTVENTGVLIYVQLADRSVEILADRGIAARVTQPEWDRICRDMERAFAAGDYRGGAVNAIRAAGDLLAAHFPARTGDRNELPDRPLLL